MDLTQHEPIDLSHKVQYTRKSNICRSGIRPMLRRTSSAASEMSAGEPLQELSWRASPSWRKQVSVFPLLVYSSRDAQELPRFCMRASVLLSLSSK